MFFWLSSGALGRLLRRSRVPGPTVSERPVAVGESPSPRTIAAEAVAGGRADLRCMEARSHDRN